MRSPRPAGNADRPAANVTIAAYAVTTCGRNASKRTSTRARGDLGAEIGELTVPYVESGSPTPASLPPRRMTAPAVLSGADALTQHLVVVGTGGDPARTLLCDKLIDETGGLRVAAHQQQVLGANITDRRIPIAHAAGALARC